VLSVILAALGVWALGQRTEAQHQRNAAQREAARAMSLALENSLISIEDALGRYLTTGEERFLTSANRALEAYPRQRDRLAQLVSDDPGQQQRVRQIGDAIDAYAELWAGPVIDIARDDPAKAADEVRTNAYRSRLDPIRRNFGRLHTRVRAIIGSRERRSDSNPANRSAWAACSSCSSSRSAPRCTCAGRSCAAVRTVAEDPRPRSRERSPRLRSLTPAVCGAWPARRRRRRRCCRRAARS
jgi:CHASE3 domain sensor protein